MSYNGSSENWPNGSYRHYTPGWNDWSGTRAKMSLGTSWAAPPARTHTATRPFQTIA
jgi:hypothetical protein